MIKDKYIAPLAMVAIILTIIGLGVGFIINTDDSTVQTSKVMTQPDYMTKLFNKDEVLQINIEIGEDEWQSLLENASAEEYVSGNLTINGETVSSVGIRAKGNSSLSMVASDDTTDRYSFKIKFDEYIKGQNFYGLDKMVLNNGIGDATYMKEYLSYDLYERFGIATPGFAFANITLNGEPWGVYLAVEALEEDFVQRNFGSLDGNLYKAESDNMGNKGAGNGQPPNRSQGEINETKVPSEEPKEPMDQMEVSSRESQGVINQIKKASSGEEKGITNQTNVPSEEPKEPMNQVEVPSRESQGEENPMNSPDGGQGNKGMGMNNKGSSAGTNLVYKDDEISSYSGIFDYTILKKTTASDQKKLIESIKNLNEGTNLEEYIDVDEVLRYFAINTFLVNLDSYASNMKHNFYLYEEDGKLQIIPWDYNLAFGGYQGQSSEKVINFPIDTPVTDTMENSPLIAKLLEVGEYKELYYIYLNQIVTEYIANGKYETIIAKVDKLINEYVKNDPTSFFNYEDYTSSLSHLVQFGKDRAESIKAQLNGEEPSDTYGNISTTVDLNKLGTMGRGQNGEDKSGMSKQIDPVIMQDAFAIIQDKSIADLSENDKLKLKEMDISEEQLETLEIMKQNRGQNVNKGNNRVPPDHMSQGDRMSGESFNALSTEQIFLLTVPPIVMIVGIVFVLGYKRKKYRSK